MGLLEYKYRGDTNTVSFKPRATKTVRQRGHKDAVSSGVSNLEPFVSRIAHFSLLASASHHEN